MSVYKKAIDQTTRTIDIRAKSFRNLVVTVVFISLAAIGWATVAWTVQPLSGLLLLFPVCGIFFFLDARALSAWRSHLLNSWATGEIDLGSFREAVSAIALLPKDTLQSMLATLPAPGDILTEREISSATRGALATTLTAIHTCRSEAAAFLTAGYTLAAGLIIAASALQIWHPLLGVAVIPALPFIKIWRKRRRLETLKVELLAAMHPDFDWARYYTLVSSFDWEPISIREREQWLTSFVFGRQT